MNEANTEITLKAGCINCCACTVARLFVVRLVQFASAGVCVLGVFRLKDASCLLSVDEPLQ